MKNRISLLQAQTALAAAAAALALAARHGLREVFGCARMYYGPPPRLPDREIFGVTTVELG